MATPAVAAHRIDRAVRLLLDGRSASATVAVLADELGISRRTARRYVAKAYGQILADLEEINVDRQHLLAQLIHCLQEGLAKALAGGHVSAAVGCARELRELTGIGFQANQPARRHHA